ncbi:MAG: hypothetical protein QGH31_09805, partial [Kiritimatiellia bacterium]|nr:hypothetical protein [Kiritimatiellia bacterium]
LRMPLHSDGHGMMPLLLLPTSASSYHMTTLEHALSRKNRICFEGARNNWRWRCKQVKSGIMKAASAVHGRVLSRK